MRNKYAAVTIKKNRQLVLLPFLSEEDWFIEGKWYCC